MISYEQLAKAVSGNEYRTLQSIGNDFGVTRERIRQLLNQHNLTDVVARQKPDRRNECPVCNLPVDKKVYNNNSPNSFGYNIYHDECWKVHKESHWTMAVCSHCKKDFKIRKGELQWRITRMTTTNDWIFCSRKCVIRYRVAHPIEGNFKGWGHRK